MPAFFSSFAADRPVKPAPTTTIRSRGSRPSIAGLDLLELGDHLELEIRGKRRLEHVLSTNFSRRRSPFPSAWPDRRRPCPWRSPGHSPNPSPGRWQLPDRLPRSDSHRPCRISRRILEQHIAADPGRDAFVGSFFALIGAPAATDCTAASFHAQARSTSPPLNAGRYRWCRSSRSRTFLWTSRRKSDACLNWSSVILVQSFSPIASRPAHRHRRHCRRSRPCP